ncbi:MAG: GNAT family N-acetyltransferase [Candidatus Binataceae bacterium]
MDPSRITLRGWRYEDVESLVRYANDREVWLNLRDRFPHPYSRHEAEEWTARCVSGQTSSTELAVDLNGEAIGAVGFEPQKDVNRLTVEIGYWLGQPFWGKGIATVAVTRATKYAFSHLNIERIEGGVFAWNLVSARVLEKAGYTLEGRLRRSIIKDGRLGDLPIYARLRP